jgi:hypothetical protein
VSLQRISFKAAQQQHEDQEPEEIDLCRHKKDFRFCKPCKDERLEDEAMYRFYCRD